MGFKAAGRLGAPTTELDDNAEGMGQMAHEREVDGPPLEQLMERLIPRSRGTARALFAGCRQALERLEEEPFPRAWRRLVEEQEALGEGGQACLLPLGEVLGRCGCREQERALALAVSRLDRERARAGEERLRMGRVYQALGLSGGAFLIILLL